MYWLGFDNGFGKSFWREKGRVDCKNCVKIGIMQRYINVCTTSIITLTIHQVRRWHTWLFALAGHLRGSFLLKITSLVAWISAQGITKRRTFFIAKKYTKRLVTLLAQSNIKRHSVSPRRRHFFNDEKYPNSHRFRQRGLRCLLVIECKHQMTAKLPPDVRKLTLVGGLTTRHRFDESRTYRLSRVMISECY